MADNNLEFLENSMEELPNQEESMLQVSHLTKLYGANKQEAADRKSTRLNSSH